MIFVLIFADFECNLLYRLCGQPYSDTIHGKYKNRTRPAFCFRQNGA